MLAKFFILANICLAFGLAAHYLLPTFISQYIDQQLALVPDSQTYPMWREPPVPVYQKFYFYNITNAHLVEQFGHKPHLLEVGPFTYRTGWQRTDIEQSTSGDVMNFKNFKSWHFEPELSVADHSFEITTLNAPLAVTLTLIQSASNAVRLLVTFSLDGLSEGFFTRRSIKQLLFDGYPDLLTTFGPLLNSEMLSQGGKFGYMNARNGTLDGLYEINTGLDDISKLNTINKFNGLDKLPYWADSPTGHCNSLEGASTGELFPVIKSEQSSEQQANKFIKLFQPDFCRVWRLDHESEHQLVGLKLERFRASRDIFKNSTELPENSCFFQSPANQHQQQQHHVRRGNGGGGGSRNSPANTNQHNNHRNHNHHNHNRQHSNNRVGRQAESATAAPSSGGRPHHNNRHHAHPRVRQEWPAGVFSLAPCKFQAPIYMSMPHFLDADPQYLTKIDGLEPDPTKHEFFIDLEPRTGSPVQVAARVQLNVAISKPPGLVRFRNIPEIMFPVFWQELSVNLTGQSAVIDQLILASRGAQEANLRISYTFLLLGLSILIATCLFHLHARLYAAKE